MTNEEILLKAVEKAVENGFNRKWLMRVKGHDIQTIKEGLIHRIIFNHDFAKAFWEEEVKDKRCAWCIENNFEGCTVCEDIISLESWKFHLQQMVLKEDPIQYIKQFIDD